MQPRFFGGTSNALMSLITGCDGKSYRRGVKREFYADIGLAVEVETDKLLDEYDKAGSSSAESME